MKSSLSQAHEKVLVRRVVYSFVVADLFHYGHLQLLETAKSLGDYHICGVLSDDAAETYRSRPIANFEERLAVISNIKCVDLVMPQASKNPEKNLREIHSQFPDAELILVHGNDWQNIPGKEYVESIGGRVVQPAYYKRLSDVTVKKRLSHQDFEGFTEHFQVKNIHYFAPREKRFTISTKGNTLQSLQPLLTLSRIEKTFIFRVGDWRKGPEEILDAVQKEFSGKVVVRSSAVNEDSYHDSKAGCYESCLGVPVRRRPALRQAVEQVLASYARKDGENELHQILIQAETRGVRLSGVVFTRHNQSGAPYYVINYDDRTRRTDTVTSGKKSVAIEICHLVPTSLCPRLWQPLIKAIREIEGIIRDVPLDIEFAIDRNKRVVIFQVRPLILRSEPVYRAEQLKKLLTREQKVWKKRSAFARGEGGRGNIFSDMAFWNPAEIIGRRPTPLAFSLYRYLITDGAWNRALLPLRYSLVPESRLMVSFAGKPYIDVRKSFNTLLPASVRGDLREKLVEYFLNKLRANPELHDKVEFDILKTCYIFGFDKKMRSFRRTGFRAEEIRCFKDALIRLTGDIVSKSNELIKKDLETIRVMRDEREALRGQLGNRSISVRERLGLAIRLLDGARENGVVPFTRLARMAFIAKAILRSLVSEGWIGQDKYDVYFDSLHTVAKELGEDFKKYSEGRLSQKAFFEKYGHLRPGTYDITSLRYDQRADLFGNGNSFSARCGAKKNGHQFSAGAMAKINTELGRNNLGFDGHQLLTFAKASLEGREAFKFEFTKNLSDALEHISLAAQVLGFSRHDAAFLDIGSLKMAISLPEDSVRRLWHKRIKKNQQQGRLMQAVSLPAVIFSEDDFMIVNHLRSKPNFVTEKSVEGPILELCTEGKSDGDDLSGRLIMIENADPGYDWIFTKNILGLITKYGGVASHMAIRCAEFGLPAAIGCGEVLFEEMKGARRIFLDCREGKIAPCH